MSKRQKIAGQALLFLLWLVFMFALFSVTAHGQVPDVQAVHSSAMSGGADQFVRTFLSYEVYLAAIVCVAGMTVSKKATRILGKDKGATFLKHPAVKLLLSIGNVPMGALFGLVPNFLPGDSIPERMMVGAVAGFMSNTIYGVVKRFFPAVMESSDAVRPEAGEEE